MRKFLLAACLGFAALSALAESHDLDKSASSVTVRVHKTGLFSAFGHEHTIAAPLAAGAIDAQRRSIRLSFHTSDMKVTDPDASDSDRSQVESTMKSGAVLDVEHFPEINFASTAVDPSGAGRYQVKGNLTLHGVTRPVEFSVTLDGVRYSGSVRLKQSDFGIAPVKVAGGAVRVKDEIDVAFVIVPAK